MSYEPSIWQIKDFKKKKNRGKLHWYNICGCQVKNFPIFLYQFSIHEIILFLGEGGEWRVWTLIPQIWFNLDQIFTEGRLREGKNSFWRIFQKVRILAEMGRTKNLKFLVHFQGQCNPRKIEILLKTKICAKSTSSGLSSNIIVLHVFWYSRQFIFTLVQQIFMTNQ